MLVTGGSTVCLYSAARETLWHCLGVKEWKRASLVVLVD